MIKGKIKRMAQISFQISENDVMLLTKITRNRVLNKSFWYYYNNELCMNVQMLAFNICLNIIRDPLEPISNSK